MFCDGNTMGLPDTRSKALGAASSLNFEAIIPIFIKIIQPYIVADIF